MKNKLNFLVISIPNHYKWCNLRSFECLSFRYADQVSNGDEVLGLENDYVTTTRIFAAFQYLLK